jgi:hypothetical protein
VAKRYGRQGRPAASRSGSRSRMSGWVDSISSAASATVLLVSIALGAIVERAIIGGLEAENPDQGGSTGGDGQLTPPRSEGDLGERSGGSAAVPASSLTREVERLTLAVRGAAARKLYQSSVTGKPIVRLSRIDSARTAAIGTSAIPIPRSSSSIPEATVFVARKTSGQWRIALAGTRNFDALLDSVPDSLVSSAEKALLQEFSGNSTSRSKQTDTGLMLPWKQGESWTLQAEAGDDGQPGPPSFVGFSRKAGKVLAAGGGRLYRLCSDASGRGLIMVIHPNGLATQYYQMSKVTTRRDGSTIRRGDYLGTVGTDRPCGGAAADAPQVWFGVRDAAGAVSLDGKNVGGWRFTESDSAPGISALRGLSRIVAGKGLQNLGSIPVLPLPGLGGEDDEPSPEPSEETPSPAEAPSPAGETSGGG